jgi:hypothetical protein
MNQNWPLLTPCQMWLRQGEKQIEKLQTSMRICPAKNELTTCLLPCFGKTLGKSLSYAAVACKAKIGKLALFTCAWNEQQVSLPHEQKNSNGSTYWTTRLTILDVVVLVVGLMLNKPDIPVAQTGPSGFPCSTDTCSFFSSCDSHETTIWDCPPREILVIFLAILNNQARYVLDIDVVSRLMQNNRKHRYPNPEFPAWTSLLCIN